MCLHGLGRNTGLTSVQQLQKAQNMKQKAGNNIRMQVTTSGCRKRTHVLLTSTALSPWGCSSKQGNRFCNTAGKNPDLSGRIMWKSCWRWKQPSKPRTKARGLTFLLQERDEKLSHSCTQSLAGGSRNHMVTKAANPWKDRILSVVPKLPARHLKPIKNDPSHFNPCTDISFSCHYIWMSHPPCTTLPDLCLHFHSGYKSSSSHKIFGLPANYY